MISQKYGGLKTKCRNLLNDQCNRPIFSEHNFSSFKNLFSSLMVLVNFILSKLPNASELDIFFFKSGLVYKN